MRCQILLSGHDVKDKDSGGCLFERGHLSQHLNLTIANGYILWEPDMECNDCGEECECFVWREISEDEAKSLMKVK